VIIIVDYGCGNIFSIKQAFLSLGVLTKITEDPEEILTAKCIILPGVGAFGNAMKSLRSTGLNKAIIKAVNDGTPILGICLGMQLLANYSSEFGHHEGLGIIPGHVEKLPLSNSRSRVSNVGWNSIYVKNSSSFVNKNFDTNMFYFIHSYCFIPNDKKSIVAVSYFNDKNITAVLHVNNIVGCQFHPEKSGVLGLKMLEEFINFFNLKS
jgi:imidazole glycerol-phosphate synthase subunit HisH